MRENINNKKFKYLLHDLAESVSENSDTANEYLLEKGFDVNTLLEKGIKLINKTKLKEKAKLNKRSNKNLIQTALEKIKNKIDDNMGAPTFKLIEILNKKSPSFQFRNLEKWDDNQIIEVLEDIDLIQLIEELDQDKID